MGKVLPEGSTFLSRSIDQEIARAWGWLKGRPELLLVGLGASLRLIVYARNHEFCFDERSLWGNIAGLPIHEFSSELSADQLAPFGFMILERAVVALLGVFRPIGRLFPLVSGLTALFLFRPLALKVLPRGAALVALSLFALSDDLIYYSSEVKQYSLDVAIAVAIALATVNTIGRPITGRTGWGMALLAVASPWFSFPAVFIVGGCGTVLIVSSLFSRRLCDAALWCVAGMAWGVSFVVAYKYSLAMLSTHTSMYKFWDFAFLALWPLPLSMLRTLKTVGILLEVFVNPLNMVHPRWAGVLLPLMVLLIGTMVLARRSWRAFVVFVVPIVLAMIASALRRYPFHGRLILELVPALYLLIGLGAHRVCDQIAGLSGLGKKVFLAALLGFPCLDGVNQSVLHPARDHNQHGDLHKNLFLQDDYSLPIQPYELIRPPGLPEGGRESEPGEGAAERGLRPRGMNSEPGDIDAFSSVHRRLVCAEAHHGPVGRGGGVGQGGAVAFHRAQEGVDQVGMRAAVTAALEEREVLGILNRGRLGEPTDGLRQQTGVVGHLHSLGDFRFRQRVLCAALGVNDGVFTLDLLPFEALLAAGGVEAFAILAGDVEEAAGDFGDDVGVPDRERGGFDGEGAAVAANEFFANPARSVADDAFGVFSQDGQAGAHAVSGVPHGRQSGPVIGPAVHVLLVAAAEELELAQLAVVMKLLDEQVFAAVDDGFHHHVNLAAGTLGSDDILAFVDGSPHGNSAGDVFAGFQGLDRHPGVVGDGGVDVDGVDGGVLEQVTIVGVSSLDAVAIAALVQPLAVAAADRADFGAGVVLIDRDELGSEAQPDDGHTDRLFARHAAFSSREGEFRTRKSAG
jgi:hypothetical protein